MKILKLPPEEWKIVPNLKFPFTDDYEVSNHGRVRRISTQKFAKGHYNREGFLVVSGYRAPVGMKNTKISSLNITVHRAVWDLFSPIPRDNFRQYIYHINKCRDDNYIWNLALMGKRNYMKRVDRLRKEGFWIFKRGPRYNHDRTRSSKK